MSRPRSVIIIGAGAGGLAAAMDLSAAGLEVSVVEKERAVGGKMRLVDVGGVGINGGPTVFTMRWVFDALFARSGADLDSELKLQAASRLARHGWLDQSRLDLWADIEQSVDAIGAFSDAKNADGYRRFCEDGRAVFKTLKDTFINAQKPNPLGLGLRVGLHKIGALWNTRPFQAYWSRLDTYFSDPRLKQLFGRYATYVGSSPFLSPATLMLIAHVEQDGVWLVDGGMHAVAKAMQSVAQRNGARFHFGKSINEIRLKSGKVTGVILDDGESLQADTIIFNGDSSALASGLLGTRVRTAAPLTPSDKRSLSALTWCTHAKTAGFDLDYHTVFFSDAYRSEFDQIFRHGEVPVEPTVYICAQDRGGRAMTDGRERLLILVNSPAHGDKHQGNEERLEEQHRSTLEHLERYGLIIEAGAPAVMTGPSGFNMLFPGTGGALYGAANHGPFATFARPGARSKIDGLYLAGGSTHPGAGVPMATLSGRLAAEAVLLRR